MKLEQQVCSLELAKKLKELGVKQDSLFWWNFMNNGYVKGHQSHRMEWRLYERKNGLESVSAFTVAELGESLPGTFVSSRIQSKLRNDYWLCESINFGQRKFDLVPVLEAETEADARANMRIYLIEQGLVKP